jgi:glycosyltransferase involved in cell wall biosynthesis
VIEHARHAAPDVETWVCALNRGGPALEAAAAAGARVLVLEKGGYVDGVQRLRRLLVEHRIDVVNGHNPTGGLYGALAGSLARVPAIVRTEHSVHYPGRHSRAYAWGMEALSTALTRTVVCVCEASRASHAGRMRWAARRFVTVPNGISGAQGLRSRAEVRGDLAIEPDMRVVLAVGSLTRQKAHHVLIDAFVNVTRELPAARLLIAGEGPLRATLEHRIADRGAGASIRLLGARSDVPDLMEGADLFVLSSEREGLSVTLLEAMRAGRPAVVTRVGGNPEAVADGETGRIVPVGDVDALGGAMVEMLADPARAARIGAAARQRWARDFTAERMVSQTEGLYRAALGASARTGPAAERKEHRVSA